MATEARYRYLENRPDKGSLELFIKDTGIRASTIWHDRYISRLSPDQIARDRDVPGEAIHEALAYCQDNWEIFCREKDSERQHLQQIGFFKPGSPRPL